MSAKVTEPRPDFYTIGGALMPTDQSYVERSADRELLAAIRHGQYCYVLTPRQMGKSSLMFRIARQLGDLQIHSVVIDLTSIGVTGLSAETWYLGQLKRVVDQLKLGVDYVAWWKEQAHLGPLQRFVDFLTHVVLQQVAAPITIFVDEIDTTLNLPGYSDDYFGGIRSLYVGRAQNPMLERLSFVLLGVASPSDLIRDTKRTPFNIGRRIQLGDFTLEEGRPLLAGLAPDANLAEALLRDVFRWTDGHPYLTQKSCAEIARWASAEWSPAEVPHIVDKKTWELFFSDGGRQTDDNLEFVRRRVLEADEPKRVLQIYGRLRSGAVVHDNELDPFLASLKLSGLVKRTEYGTLRVRNPVYERVFDQKWIASELIDSGRRAQERALGTLLIDSPQMETASKPGEFRELTTIGERSPFGLRVLSVSSEGALLATGGYDGAIRLWDATTLSEKENLRSTIHSMVGREGLITALGFSRDNRYLASGLLNGIIHIWNLRSFQELESEFNELRGQIRHAGAVKALAFSPDGSVLVSGGLDSILNVWDMGALTNGRAVIHKQGQWRGGIEDVAHARDGSWLLTGHSDGAVRAHDATTLAPIRNRVLWSRAKPTALAVSRDGRLLACGLANGELQLFEVESFQELARLEGHRKTVISVAFFPNEQLLASVAGENRLILWDLRKQLQRMRAQTGGASATLWGDDGEGFVSLGILDGGGKIACGLSDGRIRLWERAT